jgi:hypothetical protein
MRTTLYLIVSIRIRQTSDFVRASANLGYPELSKWLINAFNGEWYKTEDPVPIPRRSLGVPV